VDGAYVGPGRAPGRGGKPPDRVPLPDLNLEIAGDEGGFEKSVFGQTNWSRRKPDGWTAKTRASRKEVPVGKFVGRSVG